ncbi:MAG: DNA mismatch repair protein MutS [bacterium]|nr:DNA mismatch repair protein MutS [bacterium]
MKSSNSASGVYKPFKNLKSLLESRSVELQPAPSLDTKVASADQADQRPDHRIFKEEMADVKRISRSQCVAPCPLPPETPGADANPDHDAVVQLKKLVQYGTGFVVSLTPEYIEGTAHGVNPAIARRLHRGDFSIQDHIDLHGMRVPEAHDAVNAFLKKSIMSGKRAVLVIHGRGLSSPAKPVLKSKVYRWLTTSPWHKWVIAFTSARLCDGGTGAGYILLRRKPLTKRFRKKFY